MRSSDHFQPKWNEKKTRIYKIQFKCHRNSCFNLIIQIESHYHQSSGGGVSVLVFSTSTQAGSSMCFLLVSSVRYKCTANRWRTSTPSTKFIVMSKQNTLFIARRCLLISIFTFYGRPIYHPLNKRCHRIMQSAGRHFNHPEKETHRTAGIKKTKTRNTSRWAIGGRRVCKETSNKLCRSIIYDHFHLLFPHFLSY